MFSSSSINMAPISSWGGRGAIPGAQMAKPIATSQYRSIADLDADSLSAFNRASSATGVVRVGQQIIANAVLISSTLVLVTGHSFDETRHDVYFQFPGLQGNVRGRLLFDGARDSQFQTDFKIIQIQPITDRAPAQLSVSTSGFGRSIQFSYDESGCQYVKVYEQEAEHYATNADWITAPTQAGECGGPRLSMSSRCIQSMHQGERAGFTINQMIMTLEQALSPRKHVAENIMQQLDIPDFEMRYMQNSSIALEPGGVIPEARQPAREEFSIFLDRVSFAGSCRDGRPKYAVRVNHLMRYLADYDDAFINMKIGEIFAANGLPYSEDLVLDMSNNMLFEIEGHIPSSANPRCIGIDAQNAQALLIKDKYIQVYKNLYKLCRIASDGALVDGVREYVDPEFPISATSHISEKFILDHVVDFPSTSGRDKYLLDEAERRGIAIETVITTREIGKLSKEIRETDFAYIRSQINAYAMSQRQAFNLYFLTKDKYELCEAKLRTNKLSYDLTKKTDQFVYTVEEKGGLYYAYHYENSKTAFNTVGMHILKFGSQVVYLRPVNVPF